MLVTCLTVPVSCLSYINMVKELEQNSSVLNQTRTIYLFKSILTLPQQKCCLQVANYYNRPINRKDIKLVLGPYCGQYKCTVCFFFFSPAMGLIHLFKKKMDNAQTQNLGPAMHELGE
jgi:hypothetical protein